MIKIGDIIIPINNSSGHNYMIGHKYVVSYLNGVNGYIAYDINNNQWVGNTILFHDFEKWKPKKSDLEKELTQLKDENFKYEYILEYLNEENSETLDEKDFVSWYLIKILESDIKEKKEKISKILNTINNDVNIDKLKI